MVDRSEHNVRVFFHNQFPLEFFFGVGICEDKHYFLLTTVLLDFYSNVKEDFGSFFFFLNATLAVLVQLFKGSFVVESFVFFILGLLDHKGLVLSKLGDRFHKTFRGHVYEAAISSRENSHELHHRGNLAPVGIV